MIRKLLVPSLTSDSCVDETRGICLFGAAAAPIFRGLLSAGKLGGVKRRGVNKQHIEHLPGTVLSLLFESGNGSWGMQLMKEFIFDSYPDHYSTTASTSKILQLHRASSKKVMTTHPPGAS